MQMDPISINPHEDAPEPPEDGDLEEITIQIDELFTFTCSVCEYSWQVINWAPRRIIMCPDCGQVYNIDTEGL